MFDKWIRRVAWRLMWAGTHFFFGIGEGPSKGELTAANQIAGLAGFETGTGEGDVTTASNFWNSILSGDPAMISKVLGPQISGIESRAQAGKDTTAQFGNRSGGTNAAIQSVSDTTRGDINQLIDSLTGKAGSELGALGTNLLSQAGANNIAEFEAQDVIHGQHSAAINDLFKSITSLFTSFGSGGGSGGGGDIGSSLFSLGGGGVGAGAAGGADAITSVLPDIIAAG